MLLLFGALALDALFSSATLSGAHTGALFVDASSGNVVYARNADDAFIPASTMKLLVGSAAIDRLGDDFAFKTSLATDGSTLYLQGGGDPSLSAADADNAAAAVAALNLTVFTGGIRAGAPPRYVASRYPDGWQIDDLAYDYAAPVDTLSFAGNALHITVTPTVEGQAPSIAVSPDVKPPCMLTSLVTGATNSRDTVELQTSIDAQTYGSRICLILRGAIPAKAPAEAFDAASLEPAEVALQAFDAALVQHGVLATLPEFPNIFSTPLPGVRTVWSHDSARLPQLLRAMWQPSDNLLAETLLLEIGLRALPDGNDMRERAIADEQRWLRSIGVDPSTVTIADGSGMSAYDRITPRALVSILAHDWNGGRETVLAALPVAAQSGTLQHAFEHTALAGNVVAKTGTSNHTRTLAGYLRTPHGTLVFALLVNNWMDSGPGSADRLHAFEEAVLTRIREAPGGV